jgi:hypothetical protein
MAKYDRGQNKSPILLRKSVRLVLNEILGLIGSYIPTVLLRRQNRYRYRRTTVLLFIRRVVLRSVKYRRQKQSAAIYKCKNSRVFMLFCCLSSICSVVKTPCGTWCFSRRKAIRDDNTHPAGQNTGPGEGKISSR